MMPVIFYVGEWRRGRVGNTFQAASEQSLGVNIYKFSTPQISQSNVVFTGSQERGGT